MDPSPLNARRANEEDLTALEELWRQASLPWEQLGGFLQEFIVATDEEDHLVGAVGLLIEGDNALLHSEAIHPGVDADPVRMALWRRMQIVARNQGVTSIWTQEDAPYWQASGFDPAPAGLTTAITEAWQRYRTPIAVTEVHNGSTREEQLRWAAQVWDYLSLNILRSIMAEM